MNFKKQKQYRVLYIIGGPVFKALTNTINREDEYRYLLYGLVLNVSKKDDTTVVSSFEGIDVKIKYTDKCHIILYECEISSNRVDNIDKIVTKGKFYYSNENSSKPETSYIRIDYNTNEVKNIEFIMSNIERNMKININKKNEKNNLSYNFDNFDKSLLTEITQLI